MRNTLGVSVKSKDQENEEARYRAESDLSTLQRAAEIKEDKARMKACRALYGEQKKGLEKIFGDSEY
jgi:hypothetical protein